MSFCVRGGIESHQTVGLNASFLCGSKLSDSYVSIYDPGPPRIYYVRSVVEHYQNFELYSTFLSGSTQLLLP